MITRPVATVANEFAKAAEVLVTATRAWPIEPPRSVGQVDVVTNQLEGLRRSLIEMRVSLNPEKN